MGVIKLAIGIPAYGGRVSAEHTRMFLELGHSLAVSEARFQYRSWGLVDTCGVDIARNRLLKEALESDADWLLMIDADTWVVSNGEDDAGYQLLRMISEADRDGAAIVGAAVMRRAAGIASSEIMVYKQAISLGLPAIAGKVIEVDAIATALIAINLRKVGHLSFKFTEDLSEDLDFCRQVKAGGHKILVDGRVATAHLSRSVPLTFSGALGVPDGGLA